VSWELRKAEQVQGQPQPTDHQTACSDVARLRSGWEVNSARQGQDWHGARPSTAQVQHSKDMDERQGPELECSPPANG